MTYTQSVQSESAQEQKAQEQKAQEQKAQELKAGIYKSKLQALLKKQVNSDFSQMMFDYHDIKKVFVIIVTFALTIILAFIYGANKQNVQYLGEIKYECSTLHVSCQANKEFCTSHNCTYCINPVDDKCFNPISINQGTFQDGYTTIIKTLLICVFLVFVWNLATISRWYVSSNITVGIHDQGYDKAYDKTVNEEVFDPILLDIVKSDQEKLRNFTGGKFIIGGTITFLVLLVFILTVAGPNPKLNEGTAKSVEESHSASQKCYPTEIDCEKHPDHCDAANCHGCLSYHQIGPGQVKVKCRTYEGKRNFTYTIMTTFLFFLFYVIIEMTLYYIVVAEAQKMFAKYIEAIRKRKSCQIEEANKILQSIEDLRFMFIV